ncbi:hypothetical protein SYNTR_1970 [Candidatus Syntrophocurvum alkaliphilum]|uniref:SipL SPOCS domain-containing protein n=1 Tax=Candidatus Syntrophocurvum alkaliphilum TaxID=2293317 RepID=A0A6I6DI20_9FIRM|nr:hypothetical protein [Candidatus Syntrophocurvum alkaliphilum]QGU00564.1 hypothetical protein SYNTR_1970 [Candidatus Syntrophocurvum alkaliphilum]
MRDRELKCEFPEGCKLDLWAKVIKAKYIERQTKILDTQFCVPDEQVGGKISAVEDIKVKVIQAFEDLHFNRVKIFIDYEVILFVIVEGEFQIITVTDRYEQVIELDEFDPPLTPEEFRQEIEQSEIILRNWSFDFEIKGFCEDPDNPCDLVTPIPGTCIGLRVFVDLTVKLGMFHDVFVFGEIEPDIDVVK